MKNARVSILLLLFASLGLAMGPVVPEGGQVVAEKKRVLQGKEYLDSMPGTFVSETCTGSSVAETCTGSSLSERGSRRIFSGKASGQEVVTYHRTTPDSIFGYHQGQSTAEYHQGQTTETSTTKVRRQTSTTKVRRQTSSRKGSLKRKR